LRFAKESSSFEEKDLGHYLSSSLKGSYSLGLDSTKLFDSLHTAGDTLEGKPKRTALEVFARATLSMLNRGSDNKRHLLDTNAANIALVWCLHLLASLLLYYPIPPK